VSTRRAAREWAEVWQRAWPRKDVQAIAALYAPGAVFYSHPFRERQSPEEYVRWAFDDQVEAECRFGEAVVDGDLAVVPWWGVVTSRDGSVETIAGTSRLRFDGSGRVIEQRDAWGRREERHELPEWTDGGGAAEALRSDG
jgi:YD repeat-containing protein